MMGLFCLGLAVVSWCFLSAPVSSIGVNWGTQASHPLPPNTVVQLLKENGFQKVKLFDAEEATMKALGNSQIEVMVGIPNDMLAILATSVRAAEKWVSKNVSSHMSKHGVNIRYVAVGNEPLLPTYNGSYLSSCLPALQNIQAALIKAGLSSQVKVTIPLNANVYGTSTNLPSGGDFSSDIHDLMLAIVQFLSDNAAPFTVNIYPFISLYQDPNFPVDFAFFGVTSTPVNDGGTIYNNVFDANLDTLVWALRKNGYGNLPIIVGEIGWPTDGDRNANLNYAQQFNQGLVTHILTGNGTPMRPGPIDAYLFSLIDEDDKSIDPGNFERHWGIFYYDGKPKYQLNLGTGGTLVQAKNVDYLPQRWCILNPKASISDSEVAPSVSFACYKGDCTSLGYGTSCGDLDARGNISYAFNSYYQKFNQYDRACQFPHLSVVTKRDPSTRTCRFGIMIDSGVARHGWGSRYFVFLIIHLAVAMFLFLLTYL